MKLCSLSVITRSKHEAETHVLLSDSEEHAFGLIIAPQDEHTFLTACVPASNDLSLT